MVVEVRKAFKAILGLLAWQQHQFINFRKVAVFIVMAWIGGLKAFQYEADGIVHLWQQPGHEFFYKDAGKTGTNEKGEVVAEYALQVYVPNLSGDLPTPVYGVPYLSGAGRLVLKDVIMMAGGLIIASDCAAKLLNKQGN